MSTWGRDTPWRQGHIISQEDGKSLCLTEGGDQLAVVISHDCDLAQDEDAEPSVEIIVGRRVEELNGNYTHAKNARRLQLTFSAGGSGISLELLAAHKQTIPKRKGCGANNVGRWLS